MADLIPILWFLFRFAAFFILVGMLAWGGGLLLRWIQNRDR